MKTDSTFVVLQKVELKPFVYKGIDCELCKRPNLVTKFCCDQLCLAYLCSQCFVVRHLEPSMASHRLSSSVPRDLPHQCRLELQVRHTCEFRFRKLCRPADEASRTVLIRSVFRQS